MYVLLLLPLLLDSLAFRYFWQYLTIVIVPQLLQRHRGLKPTSRNFD